LGGNRSGDTGGEVGELMPGLCIEDGSTGNSDDERVGGMLVEREQVAGLNVGDGAEGEANASNLGHNGN